jgi:molybdopterin-containing oxidoreductase family iron-sulfur binding subunit
MPAKNKCDKHVFQQSRRKVLKGLAAGVGAIALPTGNASASVWEAFFQKHFRELNKEELTKVLTRLEKDYSQDYGKDVTVKATLTIE